ncbi:UDP-4-amino-4,6-dideoxy-N-acetyl-beta-L-altrosamine N-acetyltransferase [Caryophanon latum]|uniref:UDP-4-amino-4, 6-dideoxy-N-acetyl-beta-L-altrosamine N-acetyltransferase n=1 Tax=Caryophanon latum TaxID=33977 RepID=A0A1C0YR65_9BACL|nr:UDP-4-amino-4,6-dideoxy-N-acetyl-beta-L-altrosamine N-acetyltransferase [Caryophanon latum]OCS89632.1 UDP-4-amino-4,6-dideoxy-N-acetyl-beta-L-altrosamine N-acetyltransferase [Caryophanon latum]
MVNLRRITEQDLNMIMEWRMSPEVTKYMYTDPILTLDGQKKWFEAIQNDDTCRYWIIELDNHLPVGVLNLINIDYINQKCDWGYYLGSLEARGKGLARILECNILDYVFYELKLNKLCCEVFSFNEAVVEIHKKFGSVVEGVYKDHIFKNGQFYDVVSMGITKHRWESLKKVMNYERLHIEL